LSKKIIHQLSLSDIGGVQKSFSAFFLHALKKSNFEHHIFSMHELIDNFIDVKKYHHNLNSSLIYKIKFLFFVMSKNSVIHFYNNLGSSSVNKILNFVPYSNIIFHERGSAWNAKKQDFKIYSDNALKAKVILANSNATKIMLIKRFGINEKKIQVIQNGFLEQNLKFKPKENNRLSDKFSIGYIGRLDTPKGIHILIESAKILQSYDFFITGKGILEDPLKKLAKNYKNIHFMKSVKEPLEFISKMDVMVVPSIREPLGNVIIEAGFCKKPVIASNIDGIPEIITHGVSGILITPDQKISISTIPNNAIPIPEVVINPKTNQLQEPKEIDPLKLSHSIKELANSPKTREFYGENLYQIVKKKFNVETYYENLEKIYQSILKN